MNALTFSIIQLTLFILLFWHCFYEGDKPVKIPLVFAIFLFMLTCVPIFGILSWALYMFCVEAFSTYSTEYRIHLGLLAKRV